MALIKLKTTKKKKRNRSEESVCDLGEEFEVEIIVAKRENKENGKTEYKVIWKGFFNLDEHTWEPEENIFSKELIEDFNEREKKFNIAKLNDLTKEEIAILQESRRKREKQQQKASGRSNLEQTRKREKQADKSEKSCCKEEKLLNNNQKRKAQNDARKALQAEFVRRRYEGKCRREIAQDETKSFHFILVPTRSGRVPKLNPRYI